MKRLLLPVLAIVLTGFAAGPQPSLDAAAAAPANAKSSVVFDVAFDNRTFRTQDGLTTGDFRGNTFILNGRIFPANTIPSGDGTFSPDASGSIGMFICRGTQIYDVADTTAPPPFVATTQILRFDTDDALITEGLEAGVSPVHRAIVGGWGRYAGASGDVTLELLGFNTTGAEDYRFTFRLTKKLQK